MKSEHFEAVSEELLGLTYDDVASFDDETLNGEGAAYYEQSQIMDAVVFRNRLSGRVGNFVEAHQVRVTTHGRELSCRCTCNSGKNICIHSMALLYAWVNDGEDFMNLSRVLEQIGDWSADRVREVVVNILQQQPHLAVRFLQKNIPEWDEIEPDPLI